MEYDEVAKGHLQLLGTIILLYAHPRATQLVRVPLSRWTMPRTAAVVPREGRRVPQTCRERAAEGRRGPQIYCESAAEVPREGRRGTAEKPHYSRDAYYNFYRNNSISKPNAHLRCYMPR